MARKQRLREDAQVVSFLYDQPDSLIKDIVLSEETLTFRFDDGKGNHESFTLELTNYPDNCLLFNSRDDMDDMTGSLEEILRSICEKYTSKFANNKKSPPSPSRIRDTGMGSEEEGSDDGSELYDSSNLGSSNLMDLGDLAGSGEYLGESQEVPDENRFKRNVQLEVDVHNFGTLFGFENIRLIGIPSLESVDVFLLLNPFEVLDPSTITAWGIFTDGPIYVKLTFSDLFYLDASKPPKAELFQFEEGRKSKFGLKTQLESLLNNFITLKWPHNSGKRIEAMRIEDPTPFMTDGYVPPHRATGASSFLSSIQYPKEKSTSTPPSSSSSSAPSTTKTTGAPSSSIATHPPPPPPPSIPSSSISSLLDMGFDSFESYNALTRTKGEIEEAADLLLNFPEKCRSPAEGYPKWEDSSAVSSSSSSSSSSKPLVSAFTKVSSEPPSPPSSSSSSSSSSSFSSSSGLRRINMSKLCPSANVPLKSLSDPRQIHEVTSSYGFLVMLMTYLRRRIVSVNDFCVICDQVHVFASGNMLKPAVCTRELCVWSFQQLGVGIEAAQDIATEAEVVDLLVSFANLAVNSNRREIIFDPFPSVFDPQDPKHMCLDPKRKDFSLVIEILKVMPSIEMMANAKNLAQLKANMDLAHKYCYPLMQWIISSNRSHIVLIPKGHEVKSMCTPHQYLLLSAPPEKEEKFRALKKKHGSTFAFHGSAIENWHSILRRGLINASGTQLQVNGAAYGSGIYLSPYASMSFGYSRMANYSSSSSSSSSSDRGNRFLSGKGNMGCIAICEVIDVNIRKSGDIWVQPDEDAVVTRFFFVYPDGNPGNATNLHTQNQIAFKKELEQAASAIQL